jgi:hypothetical protein
VIVTGIELVEPSVPGVMTGVATVGVIVYLAVATAELLLPLCSAIASMVSDVDTAMAPVYLVELLVGVVPFVV